MSAVDITPRRNTDAIIGENVHRLMFRARRSQTEVALNLGMTQGALSRKLRGERPWYAEEIQEAAAIFKVAVGSLFVPLPDLDSNQEPAGFKPRLTLVDNEPDRPASLADILTFPKAPKLGKNVAIAVP